MSAGVLVITAAEAAELEQLGALPVVAREDLCTVSAACVLAKHEAGPCVQIARDPYVEPDFGPSRAVKR